MIGRSTPRGAASAAAGQRVPYALPQTLSFAPEETSSEESRRVRGKDPSVCASRNRPGSSEVTYREALWELQSAACGFRCYKASARLERLSFPQAITCLDFCLNLNRSRARLPLDSRAIRHHSLHSLLRGLDALRLRRCGPDSLAIGGLLLDCYGGSTLDQEAPAPKA